MRLRGELQFPGDKSISHRVLIAGALAHGKSFFTNCATGLDVKSTAACLRQCGIELDLRCSVGTVTGGEFKNPLMALHCGNSGTTARLLTGLLAGQHIQAELTGDVSLSDRPMGRVLHPLRIMGADVHATNRKLPLKIRSAPLKGISYTLPVPSAQVKSAILLAGLGAEGQTVIFSPLPSRDHTEIMLKQSGVNIEIRQQKIILSPGTGELEPFKMDLPGDPSTASFFAAAAAVLPGSELFLKNILANPSRIGFFEILRKMNAGLEWLEIREDRGEKVGDLRVQSGTLQGVEIGEAEIPALIDELPILAVLATQAVGKTVVTGAGELRVKETDRIRAISENLKKIGGDIEELPDGFIISGPSQLHGGEIKTYGDHRIAMAFSVAALLSGGPVRLDDEACIDVSCPEFFQLIRKACN